MKTGDFVKDKRGKCWFVMFVGCEVINPYLEGEDKYDDENIVEVCHVKDAEGNTSSFYASDLKLIEIYANNLNRLLKIVKKGKGVR